MLSIPKYPEQYAQHFPAIFYLLCCASQHHVLPHTGARYTVGHWRSPCGAGVSLARPDKKCALPAAPHRTQTALRPSPCACGTLGRWPTVSGVSRLIAAAGLIRSPRGGANPVGQVLCQRPPMGVGGSSSGWCVVCLSPPPPPSPAPIGGGGGGALLCRSAQHLAVLGAPCHRRALLLGCMLRSK